MVGVSRSLSNLLRRKGIREMQRSGFASLRQLHDRTYMIEREAPLVYIYDISG